MVGTMASCLARRSSSIDSRCPGARRSEEHTSELQSQSNLVCRLLLEKKNYQPRSRGQGARRTYSQRERPALLTPLLRVVCRSLEVSQILHRASSVSVLISELLRRGHA